MIKNIYSVPKQIVEISRELRKNMTVSEKLFWNHIRGKRLGLKFLRQHPIYTFTEDSGFHRFTIPDFYNHELKLIVEIDRNIHDLEEITALDAQKEVLLKNLGYEVIRFTNTEISENMSGCIQLLKIAISKRNGA